MMRMTVWIWLVLLGAATASAADLPGAWTVLTPGGGIDIRALVPPGAACPKVVADGRALDAAPRGAPTEAFPVQLCVAHAGPGTRQVSVDGLPAPGYPNRIDRVVVIGDSGCRIKGKTAQDCNSPSAWPFATVARLAAARKPDLVIDVGDYHYRESACPAGRTGCAGSPFGDNWAVWKADVFTPAAPLLAAAPWAMSRGNHELCGRGGVGWFHLMDPHADVLDCPKTTEPYALHLDRLELLMFDGVDADDDRADPAKVAVYRDQLAALFKQAHPHAWLVTHRPFWALAQGDDIPPGATLNATEQAAIRGQVPAALDMVLSGHVHDFTSYDFGPGRPAQLIVGDAGDNNDAIVQRDLAGIALDGMKPQRAFGISDYGYLVLDRAVGGWAATLHGVDDRVLATCRLAGRSQVCRAVGVPAAAR